MRPIIYRGRDQFSDGWIHGFPLHDADIKDRWYIVSDFSGFLDKSIIIAETLGQYSGMNDKQRTKIFEGDILECINADGIKIRVVCKFGRADRILFSATTGFHNECSIYGFYFDYKGLATYPIINNYEGTNDLEILKIIGNIHDNPELLTNE